MKNIEEYKEELKEKLLDEIEIDKLKNVVGNYFEGTTIKREKIFNNFQVSLGYIRTKINNSLKEGTNYYDLIGKQVYLEPKYFDKEGIELESIGILTHETMHVFFSKGKPGINKVIFDKKKPLLKILVNVYEDIRINNLSKNFYSCMPNVIKLGYLEGIRKFQFSGDKNSDFINGSIYLGVLGIGNKDFNKFIDKEEELNKIRNHYKDFKIIEDFIKSILKEYGNFGKTKNSIRTTFEKLVNKIIEEILPLYDESPIEQEIINKGMLEVDLLGGGEGNGKGEIKGEDEDGEGNGKGSGKGEEEKEGGTGGEIEEGNYEDGEDGEKLGNGKNKGNQKIKIENKENKDYKEIKERNSVHINKLRSRLQLILEKQRTRIIDGYNKGKTINSSRLIGNVLREKSKEIKRDEIMNGTFRRNNRKGNKTSHPIILNLDVSSSMYGENLERSKEILIIISESLLIMKNDLIINAYNTENEVVYDGSKLNNLQEISNIEAGGGTSELDTIKVVKEQFNKIKKRNIHKFNKIKGLCIFITDGYGENIKDKITEMREMGIEIIGLGIGVGGKVFEDNYGKGNFIEIENLNSLKDKLTDILKTKIGEGLIN